VLIYAFVHVFTDEGVIGISPCQGSKLNKVLIEDMLVSQIVNEDPFNVERIWEKMFWYTLQVGRKGAPIIAMSAIDIAIWDIIGKALNTPVHKLLGGHREIVPCYGSGINLNYSLHELVEEMTSYVEQGFKMVKMKMGKQDPDEDLQRVKAVRDAIGSSVDLAVDVNNGWSLNNALRMTKKLERYDIYWLEEPILADDIEGLAKLASDTSIPITVDENHYTKYGFRELIEKGAVEIVQADIGKCGGVTEFKKIAGMSEAWGLPVCPHHTEYVDIPLVAAIPNGLFVEYIAEFFGPVGQIFRDPIHPIHGNIVPSNKPGFGMDLDESVIEKFKIRPSPEQLRHVIKKGWLWPPHL